MLKPPTEDEVEAMLKSQMEELCRESGGEFDDYTAAFFAAGFRSGILAIYTRESREVLGKLLLTHGRKAH